MKCMVHHVPNMPNLPKSLVNWKKVRQKIVWMVAGAVAVLGILSGHLKEILAFL